MGEALQKATERAIENATAKAEIEIEKVLRKLERDTMKKIKMVSVDSENCAAPSVEIYLND